MKDATGVILADKDILTDKKKAHITHFISNKWLYIMLIPGISYYIIFNYVPMYGILIAFKNFDIVKGVWGSKWIGFDNFKYLFHSQDFYQVFANSLILNVYRLLWGFPAPIFLALLLNEVRSSVYKRSIQTAIYLPHFISWVVIVGIINNFLSPSGGLVNKAIELFGGKPVPFLQKPEYFRSILVVSEIWKEAGWGTIIYLAAMSGIDLEQYESAIIDGATRVQRMIYITLPGIMNTIVVLLILRMGALLRNGFEQVFLLYNPLVYEVADILETYSYRIGLQEGRYGYATALGLFTSVIGFMLVRTANKLSKKFNDYSIW